MQTTTLGRRPWSDSLTGKKCGFSLVELIIVITIITILSSIGVVSYTNTSIDARDATRKTDMGEIKVRLRTTKQRLGSYVLPASPFTMSNSGVVAVSQGSSDAITVDNGSSFRADPRTGMSYVYSTIKNRQSYQIGMTFEGTNNLRAYVDGDYISLLPSIFPSLILALKTTGNVEVNPAAGGTAYQNTFVVNNGSLNIPYDLSGSPVATAVSLLQITTEDQVSLPQTSEYTSCQSIYEGGRSMGAGNYLLISSTGAITSTGCVMNPPTY